MPGQTVGYRSTGEATWPTSRLIWRTRDRYSTRGYMQRYMSRHLSPEFLALLELQPLIDRLLTGGWWVRILPEGSFLDGCANQAQVCHGALGFFVENFSWHARTDLGTENLLDELDPDTAAEKLAEFLWAVRHLPLTPNSLLLEN